MADLRRCATALALLLAGSAVGAEPAPQAAAFALSARCPPSFAREDGAVCRLVTRYDAYDSVQDAGLGGTRTGLPARRDGFTAQQIDLGRYLFFDPLLSGDGSVSCASCHQPARGFGDGRGRSIGAAAIPTRRGAPTLWNSAFLRRLFWDGRAASLEAQVKGPLYSPVEMGNTPPQLLAALRANAHYPQLFAEAFPGSTALELDMVYTALAAFEASLVSLNSRYDRYALGHQDSLTADEKAGLNVFRSFVARCAECHTPPLFTNQQIAVIGAPEAPGSTFDAGAGDVLGEPALRGGFRVPTLRNIARTAPYMHSGGFATLRETVSFYNGGRGHALPDDLDLQLHWHIWDPQLSEHEIDLIVTFLATLTDESLMPVIPDRVPSGLPVAPVFQPAAAAGERPAANAGDAPP